MSASEIKDRAFRVEREKEKGYIAKAFEDILRLLRKDEDDEF